MKWIYFLVENHNKYVHPMTDTRNINVAYHLNNSEIVPKLLYVIGETGEGFFD